ncbi:hypothetical protein K1X84_12315 [bacterium]|nr:hypothetical protein [bacterium]
MVKLPGNIGTMAPETVTSQTTSNPDVLLEVGLDPALFKPHEIKAILDHIHVPKEFPILLETFHFEQLDGLLASLIAAGVKFCRERLNMKADEKTIRNRLENLMDYKERVGCSEPIEACINDGCHNINLKCATRKTREDILRIIDIFESRRHRSEVPHVAIELFFKKLIQDYNCIGLVLSDKNGSPKIFTTDGSGISTVITDGAHRLSEAIEEGEFRFSKPGEPYLLFNQRFFITQTLSEKLVALENNQPLSKYIKKITFSSVGFDFAHEKMILSIIYIGDNIIRTYLQKAIAGIQRIKLETDPEARLRYGFGRSLEV